MTTKPEKTQLIADALHIHPFIVLVILDFKNTAYAVSGHEWTQDTDGELNIAPIQ